AGLPRCNADDEGENDRSLTASDIKPDRSTGTRCQIECRLIHLSTVALAFGVALLSGSSSGQQAGDHTVLSPQDVKWGAAPPSLPPGAQAAVLYGDPTKEGLFAFRIRMPKDYRIPPHTHPKPEIVTVISGTARLGIGETADRGKAQVLPTGSFF